MASSIKTDTFDKNEALKTFNNCGSCRHRIGKAERKKRKKRKRRASAQWNQRDAK
jgi:hypothetical protein